MFDRPMDRIAFLDAILPLGDAVNLQITEILSPPFPAQIILCASYQHKDLPGGPFSTAMVREWVAKLIEPSNTGRIHLYQFSSHHPISSELLALKKKCPSLDVWEIRHRNHPFGLVRADSVKHVDAIDFALTYDGSTHLPSA